MRYPAPPSRPPQIYLGHIPKGYPGTQKTVAHMQNLIRAGAKDFHVRQKAIDILLVKGVKAKDYLGEIKALFEWVQSNIRYTKDPFRLEVLHSPQRMLELRAGDCDDMSILLGAMLEAIGHPVRLVLAGPDPLQPRLFTHVYLEAYLRGRWIPLDPTMPHAPGWAPRTLVKKIVPIERRVTMMSEDMELQGLAAPLLGPDWLVGFIRAVRREAISPKDERVRRLWNLLRQRQILNRNPWLRAVLRRIWDRGLVARQRPRTTRRLVQGLRSLGILPPRSMRGRVAARPLTPIRVRPIRPLAARPRSLTPARTLTPVQVRPIQSLTTRPRYPARPLTSPAARR